MIPLKNTCGFIWIIDSIFMNCGDVCLNLHVQLIYIIQEAHLIGRPEMKEESDVVTGPRLAIVL